ncbi:uncharacterized protein SPPG_06841 [Spizellomyces punctatus DAOM BR117]|uniref:Uncharacterized protein n=1 Tax=Spizellomyces punctatus (strain DAOM BR117) TaxID=645134 RepID=A0A0L0H8I6_SPIPD|nr:uncharacterized protein SPPG_06841 [Spizellomyces punctatus DAOM BR117]KNC97845.1 hypothetical protein SPPG_06841 [Spizellomyces punctatus DAOM BR117]|eukprot:XP_016605885.1 hypothetical protein SPPG_06841 [Spizellomyces punctatus DAOM BR117]
MPNYQQQPMLQSHIPDNYLHTSSLSNALPSQGQKPRWFTHRGGANKRQNGQDNTVVDLTALTKPQNNLTGKAKPAMIKKLLKKMHLKTQRQEVNEAPTQTTAMRRFSTVEPIVIRKNGTTDDAYDVKVALLRNERIVDLIRRRSSAASIGRRGSSATDIGGSQATLSGLGSTTDVLFGPTSEAKRKRRLMLEEAIGGANSVARRQSLRSNGNNSKCGTPRARRRQSKSTRTPNRGVDINVIYSRLLGPGWESTISHTPKKSDAAPPAPLPSMPPPIDHPLYRARGSTQLDLFEVELLLWNRRRRERAARQKADLAKRHHGRARSAPPTNSTSTGWVTWVSRWLYGSIGEMAEESDQEEEQVESDEDALDIDWLSSDYEGLEDSEDDSMSEDDLLDMIGPAQLAALKAAAEESLLWNPVTDTPATSVPQHADQGAQSNIRSTQITSVVDNRIAMPNYGDRWHTLQQTRNWSKAINYSSLISHLFPTDSSPRGEQEFIVEEQEMSYFLPRGGPEIVRGHEVHEVLGLGIHQNSVEGENDDEFLFGGSMMP